MCVCVCVSVSVCVCVCACGPITLDCFDISLSSALELNHSVHNCFWCMLGYFGVSIIHRTLARTAGSLTCLCYLSACVYAHGGPLTSTHAVFCGYDGRVIFNVAEHLAFVCLCFVTT